MNISGITIMLCGLPWLVSSYAAFVKLREVYRSEPDLPPRRKRILDPAGLNEAIEVATRRRLGSIVHQLKQAALYSTISTSAFTAMTVSFAIDFVRNVFFATD